MTEHLHVVRDAYQELTGKASDVARQLAFAGIGVIWIFRISGDSVVSTLPEALLPPTVCFVLALTLDLLQYATSAVTYGLFSWRLELRVQRNEVVRDDHPAWFNRVPIAFWVVKVLLVIVGYGFLLSYLWNLVFLPAP